MSEATLTSAPTIDLDGDYAMTIDGRRVTTLATMPVVNPATGKAFAQAPAAGAADLESAVSAANAAFPAWRATPITERRRRLKAAADILEANVEGLARLFTREQGRPVDGARGEILQAVFWMRAGADLELPVEVTEDTLSVASRCATSRSAPCAGSFPGISQSRSRSGRSPLPCSPATHWC